MAQADYEGWMATAYDAGRSLTADAVRAWRDAARPFLRADNAGLVLDLGAGAGRFSQHLAEWSRASVLAVEPAFAIARQAKGECLAHVHVVVGRAEAIPLRDRSLDAVWLSNVIHHFEDLEVAASELRRVLWPGGSVLIRGALGREGANGGSGADLRIYRYFPAARRCADAFPSRRRILEAFGRVGFVEEAARRVTQVTATSLSDFYERIRAWAASTLALDDRTFATGLEALEDDAAAEISPAPVMDSLDFVVLRARRAHI